MCVEVDDAHPGRVRDSKDPDGPRLNFSPTSWQAFIIAIRAGEFDAA
ncbi:DUF397 domain-containing protein [Kitasatospora sp. NPDC059827]